MIYGYIRVSTDKQTTENQRFEISQYVDKNNLVIDQWINETISATKAEIVAGLEEGDLVYVKE